VTWKEKTIALILLMIARMMANPELAKEIKALSNRIQVDAPEPEDEWTVLPESE
jgi:hypothetical protein